jgi:predicted transcriptional regulator
MLREDSRLLRCSNSSGSAEIRRPTAAILSIKPVFAAAIFDGSKQFEYRRKSFKSKIPSRIFVYASAPISMVVGHFELDGVLTDSPIRLWERTRSGAGISRKYFLSYFSGCDAAHALRVGERRYYREPIDLEQQFGLARPPQSFCYVSG